MRSIVADTGPIVSFLYRDDPDHALVKAYLRDHPVALVTTWPVIAEAWHLLLARVGIKPALALMRWVKANGLRVVAPHEDDPTALLELLERYADHPMDLADATLVLLAERSGITEVLTLDRPEFDSYRTRDGRSLVNPLPARGRGARR
ncbi:MAG: PIN domain-containing protein [Betaproteobacteria bacterium]|nr:PIN domain-containing protein [Betaproteobacteria bacterium]